MTTSLGIGKIVLSRAMQPENCRVSTGLNPMEPNFNQVMHKLSQIWDFEVSISELA
jgi:hypothetical protein